MLYLKVIKILIVFNIILHLNRLNNINICLYDLQLFCYLNYLNKLLIYTKLDLIEITIHYNII